MPEPRHASEAEELLFSYAAGALDEAGRKRIEAMLDADPALRQRLKWYEAVCDGFIARLPEPSGLPAVERILDKVRPPRKDTSSTRWNWWKPAAAALIVVQAVAIGVLLNERREEPLYRSIGSPSGEAKKVIFVVGFRPDTPESKLRALLVKAGATIVDGPKQLGDYRVAVPASRAQYAQQLFEDSGIAEYVRRQE